MRKYQKLTAMFLAVCFVFLNITAMDMSTVNAMDDYAWGMNVNNEDMSDNDFSFPYNPEPDPFDEIIRPQTPSYAVGR